MRFILPFLVYILLEIAVFAWVGEKVGVLGTVVLVVASSAFGLALVKRQGLETLRRADLTSRRGQALPDGELWDALCLPIAGVLFLIPGFISDLLGAALLVPGVRHTLRARLGGAVAPRAAAAPFGGPFGKADKPAAGVTVIEGEFIEVRRDDEGAGGR